jgi:DNA-binding MarR family transcriptional regulator
MSIIRVERMSQPYTMIANATLQDTSVSLEARGLLTYLLSKPDTWAVVVTWLQVEMNVGRVKLNSIIKELENAGYIKTQVIREDGQILRYERIVYESPTAISKPVISKPVISKPAISKPASTRNTPIKERVKKEQIVERNEVILASENLSVLMQELRVGILGDRFLETKRQKEMMAVLVRQHGEDTVRGVMEWAMANSFWATTVVTPMMLHKHFPKLKAQQMRSPESIKSGLEEFLEKHPEEDDQ